VTMREWILSKPADAAAAVTPTETDWRDVDSKLAPNFPVVDLNGTVLFALIIIQMTVTKSLVVSVFRNFLHRTL